MHVVYICFYPEIIFYRQEIEQNEPRGDHRCLNLTGLDIMCRLSLLKSAIKYHWQS